MSKAQQEIGTAQPQKRLNPTMKEVVRKKRVEAS